MLKKIKKLKERMIIKNLETCTYEKQLRIIIDNHAGMKIKRAMMSKKFVKRVVENDKRYHI